MDSEFVTLSDEQLEMVTGGDSSPISLSATALAANSLTLGTVNTGLTVTGTGGTANVANTAAQAASVAIAANILNSTFSSNTLP